MIMIAMSYFCRQNVSQISLEIFVNCSHPSEILASAIKSIYLHFGIASVIPEVVLINSKVRNEISVTVKPCKIVLIF